MDKENKQLSPEEESNVNKEDPQKDLELSNRVFEVDVLPKYSSQNQMATTGTSGLAGFQKNELQVKAPIHTEGDLTIATNVDKRTQYVADNIQFINQTIVVKEDHPKKIDNLPQLHWWNEEFNEETKRKIDKIGKDTFRIIEDHILDEEVNQTHLKHLAEELKVEVEVFTDLKETFELLARNWMKKKAEADLSREVLIEAMISRNVNMLMSANKIKHVFSLPKKVIREICHHGKKVPIIRKINDEFDIALKLPPPGHGQMSENMKEIEESLQSWLEKQEDVISTVKEIIGFLKKPQEKNLKTKIEKYVNDCEAEKAEKGDRVTQNFETNVNQNINQNLIGQQLNLHVNVMEGSNHDEIVASMASMAQRLGLSSGHSQSLDEPSFNQSTTIQNFPSLN